MKRVKFATRPNLEKQERALKDEITQKDLGVYEFINIEMTRKDFFNPEVKAWVDQLAKRTLTPTGSIVIAVLS